MFRSCEITFEVDKIEFAIKQYRKKTVFKFKENSIFYEFYKMLICKLKILPFIKISKIFKLHIYFKDSDTLLKSLESHTKSQFNLQKSVNNS